MTDGGQSSDASLLGGEELTGEVLGLFFADKGTGFGVVEILPEGADESDGEGLRCSGPLADLVEGQVVRLVGRWGEHPRHGPTFEATFYEQCTPTTTAGLRTFLLSGRFGLDVATTERLLRAFGDRTGWVIEHEPDRLRIEGRMDAEAAADLHEQWLRGRVYAELVRVLAPAGLPDRLTRATFGRFGADAPAVLRDDPYRLLDVDGARFAHADALARTLGVGADDPRRLRAAAIAAHAGARGRDGHLYLTREQCAVGAAGLLGADAVVGAEGLALALASGRLVADHVAVGGTEVEAVYTPGGLAAERALAGGLARLRDARPRYARLADDVGDERGLTEEQASAARAAFASGVSVLTGGPGTGKTYAIRAIVETATRAGLEVALCAPTGRAAKRVEELVGHAATTVHRLLEARPDPEGDGFTFGYGGIGDGPVERLPHDVVVCDETSMCDTWLAAHLVSAVDDGAHLVLVGDPDQLPPVGPGDVLRDLLADGGGVPAVTLTEVHRQAAESRIVRLAHALNRGDVPALPGVDGDVFMAEEPVRRRIVPRVVEAVATRIPAYFGVDPTDIQVVAPMYRGEAGVDALNAALKEALNPPGGQRVAGLEVGDRVMQTRNDAERDVSNGDVGHVVDVDPGRGVLRVGFPRGEVVYDAGEARDLTHAWAMTVHKSQGGEWPVVVFVCDVSHRVMLWRNLAYTAVTRARRALVVVGQVAALRTAAAHDRPRDRQTLLAARLAAGAGEPGRMAGARGGTRRTR